MKTLLALLLSCSVALAADAPKLPKEIVGNENTLITVTADCPGVVKFKIIDSTGLVIVPADKLINKKELLLFGKSGRYRILAWTADKDGPSDLAETLLIIGTPDDSGTDETPLLKSLRMAYANESLGDKAKVKLLAQCYRDTAQSLDNGNPMTHGAVQTTELSYRTKAVGDSLPGVRAVAGKSVSALLSNNPDAVLTKSQRDTVIAQFKQLATYLDMVSK